MPTFPTLSRKPSFPLDEEREDAVIRSNFEGGYELSRVKFTKIRYTWTVSYSLLPDTDKATLEAFVTSVQGGADSFTWTNPVDSVVHTVRFSQIPKYSCTLQNNEASYFDVNFQLRSV